MYFTQLEFAVSGEILSSLAGKNALYNKIAMLPESDRSCDCLRGAWRNHSTTVGKLLFGCKRKRYD